MTRQTLVILRVLGVMPLVLPLLLWPFVEGNRAELGFVLSAVSGVGYVAVWSLYLGGIPYLFFYGFHWRWMRDKTLRQVMTRLVRAPILFLPCQLGFVLVASFFAGKDFYKAFLLFGFVSVPADLVIGYLYVGVGVGIFCVLERQGIISDLPDDAPKNSP